eukprot:CAMPEP_0172518196 /NCGR_PEP_ID=MMETSP1066-20121228/290671_1 /TAXON_ID=671091 /ORGANISM="Coscinodiscus wailesii, Strain CCMP2513" /LENGTH=859 /DNA_ID=CAMNT_0013300529 /DNA_START=119 /DNA_END=2698 /DNA_ORIENTATION=+
MSTVSSSLASNVQIVPLSVNMPSKDVLKAFALQRRSLRLRNQSENGVDMTQTRHFLRRALKKKAVAPIEEELEEEPVDELEEEPVDELEEEPVDELEDEEPVDELEDEEPVDELEDEEPVDELEDEEPVDELDEDEEPVDELDEDEELVDELDENDEFFDDLDEEEEPLDELLDEAFGEQDDEFAEVPTEELLGDDLAEEADDFTLLADDQVIEDELEAPNDEILEEEGELLEDDEAFEGDDGELAAFEDDETVGAEDAALGELGDDEAAGDDFADDIGEDIPDDDFEDEDYGDEIDGLMNISNCHNNMITAYIALGEPSQFFQVALDTTTSDFWVPSTDCENCNSDWNKFDGAFSATYSLASDENNEFEATTKKGDTIQGTRGVEVLKFGKLTLENQMFGVINKFPEDVGLCELTDGVLGLGKNAEEDTDYPPVIDQLGKGLKNNVFSLYIPSEPDDYKGGDGTPMGSNAMLILGGVSQRHYDGCLTWIGSESIEELPNAWSFKLDAVKIGFKSVKKNINAVLDTTSPVITLDSSRAKAFFKVNKAKCHILDEDGGKGDEVNCNKQPFDIAVVPCDFEDFAPLEFEFNGRTFTFGVGDLTTFMFTDEDNVNQCMLHVAADPNAKHVTLGLPWFNRIYTVFNPSASELGFSEMTTFEEEMDQQIDICDADMVYDLDIKQGLEMVEEMEESIAEEMEDIVEEEEEVFEDAEEVMEEVFEDVEEEVEEVLEDDDSDDEFEELANDDDDDESEEFLATDDQPLLDELVAQIDDDNLKVTEEYAPDVTEASYGVTIAGKSVSTKSVATVAGAFIVVALLAVLFKKRRRYGRSGVPESELRPRGPFDDWRARGDDEDGKRFVID